MDEMGDVPLKRCKTCGEEKPATLEFFYRQRRGKYGVKTECKVCAKAHANLPEVREQRLAYLKEYNSRPEIQERSQSYRDAYYGRPDVKARRRAYNSRPDRREQDRAYRRRTDIQARDKIAREAYRNRPGMKARLRFQQKAYHSRIDVKERTRAYLKTYHKSYYNIPENRDRLYSNVNNRRIRKQSVSGTHTPAQIKEQLKRQRYRCYYCSVKFQRMNGQYVYHVEHTFPISRVAGTDIPANDISYIVLACKPCNLSKHDKFPWEWPEGGRLL